MQIRNIVIPTELEWLTIVPKLRPDGKSVRMFCKPVTRVEQAAARAMVQRKKGELTEAQGTIEGAGGAVENVPDMTQKAVSDAMDDLFYGQALGRIVILEWEGVVDEEGNPQEVTPENIDTFMRLPYFGDLFVSRVQGKIMAVLLEGEDSPVAANGTTAAGEDTANDAKSQTSPAVEEKGAPTGTDAPS